jgi:hypothetical protein
MPFWVPFRSLVIVPPSGERPDAEGVLLTEPVTEKV